MSYLLKGLACSAVLQHHRCSRGLQWTGLSLSVASFRRDSACAVTRAVAITSTSDGRKNTVLKTTQETFRKFYPSACAHRSLSSPVYEEREKNENMHLSRWLYQRHNRYYILNIYQSVYYRHRNLRGFCRITQNKRLTMSVM